MQIKFNTVLFHIHQIAEHEEELEYTLMRRKSVITHFWWKCEALKFFEKPAISIRIIHILTSIKIIHTFYPKIPTFCNLSTDIKPLYIRTYIKGFLIHHCLLWQKN